VQMMVRPHERRPEGRSAVLVGLHARES